MRVKDSARNQYVALGKFPEAGLMVFTSHHQVIVTGTFYRRDIIEALKPLFCEAYHP